MKTHTFRVTGSFVIQYSFTEAEVAPDPEGHEGDLAPTEAALALLQADLEATLSETYAVSSMSLDAESDDLLGTTED